MLVGVLLASQVPKRVLKETGAANESIMSEEEDASGYCVSIFVVANEHYDNQERSSGISFAVVSIQGTNNGMERDRSMDGSILEE